MFTSTHSEKHTDNKGFTLVEVLVAVFIATAISIMTAALISAVTSTTSDTLHRKTMTEDKMAAEHWLRRMDSRQCKLYEYHDDFDLYSIETATSKAASYAPYYTILVDHEKGMYVYPAEAVGEVLGTGSKKSVLSETEANKLKAGLSDKYLLAPTITELINDALDHNTFFIKQESSETLIRSIRLTPSEIIFY